MPPTQVASTLIGSPPCTGSTGILSIDVRPPATRSSHILLGMRVVAAVRAFVQAGGRLVAVDRASDFAIHTLGLNITSTVEGLKPQQFYIPGSILGADLVPGTPVTRGLAPHAAVWFWGGSRAFDAGNAPVTVDARYAAADSLLLSGWMLGGEHIAGKGPRELVFTTESGAPLRSSNFRQRYWLDAVKACGLAELRVQPAGLRELIAAGRVEELRGRA